MARNLKVYEYLVKLKLLGFNPGTPDGIWGKNTQRAYEEAIRKGVLNKDGLFKNNTNKVKINKSKSNSWKPDSTENSVLGKQAYAYDTQNKKWITTQECAQWANDALRHFKDSKGRYIYNYDEIGGDAWTRLGSGKGSKMIFSGYEGTNYDPDNYSLAMSNKRNWDASDRVLKEFDSKTLDKNKVYLVNMYYNLSPNKSKAWKEATNGTTGTHTGNLYWNPDSNSWRVAHNIHGKIHDDDFISIQGRNHNYGVTAIAEPYNRSEWDKDHPVKALINKVHDFGRWKNGGKINSFQRGGVVLPEITVTSINPNLASSKSGKNFIRALNRNRNSFMKYYNLSDLDYADLSRFAVNIAQRESTLGSGKNYNFKRLFPDFIIQTGKVLFRGKSQPLSRGLTQIKYNDDIKDPELKKEYDAWTISDSGLKYDPDLMAKATIIRTMRGNKYLNRRNNGQLFTYNDNTVIPHDTALAMWWNRGKLTNGVNEPTSNLEASGVTGHARRFEHESLIKN